MAAQPAIIADILSRLRKLENTQYSDTDAMCKRALELIFNKADSGKAITYDEVKSVLIGRLPPKKGAE